METTLLSITNDFYNSYFCKNDICVSVDNDYFRPFVEIPDINGNIKLYISETYSYESLKLNNTLSKKCFGEICISHKCNNDSECLYNKCIDSYCIFNDKAPITHCDNIYLGHRQSYTYCGKAYGDICNSKDECSSKKCYDNTCGMSTDGPSDSETMPSDAFIYFYYSIVAGVVVIKKQ
ncbi:hypothetical protein PIROE2DRAFT_17492 [Piromyces sp. E2]|nr:hypothetical protein PIROE2DRAFT_17492 [Piromyces sp. E2]|eukprot:OUM57505.1 hypothetical protein PIROE2DRAFT_17492 [Piromyces sp. E2]